jgi:lipopolysaccharide biosynthesis glycosyltransferase
VPSTTVGYVATPSHLFQTVLSATQARRFAPSDADVVVACITDRGEEVPAAFRRVCAEHGVRLVPLPADWLGGAHPTFGRFFLDRVLPRADQVLYLDGDTQVIAALDPLMNLEVPAGGLLAARDPMAFLRAVHEPTRARIDGWWDDSEIPAATRERYVNSGVMQVRTADLATLRDGLLEVARTSRTRFADQDALNLVMNDRIELVSTAWNFPGFLLGTRFEPLARPRIVHFMSNPRPWNAALRPWGRRYWAPYEALARDFPEVEPFWERFSRAERARYLLQQSWKTRIERAPWQRADAVALFERQESQTVGTGAG